MKVLATFLLQKYSVFTSAVKVAISSTLSVTQDKEFSPGKISSTIFTIFSSTKVHGTFVFPILSDIQKFYQFVDGIRAEGGQDEAEDVFGGLDAMLKLNWQKVGTKVSN